MLEQLAERRKCPTARGARISLLLACPLLLGCFGGATGLRATPADPVKPDTDAESAPLGRFEVASIGAPPGTIAPRTCLAGDHELFLGADLVDPESGLVVRLAIDPLYGPALRVFDEDEPFDRSVLFFREECTTFGMDFGETGASINGVTVRSLELDVDCENEEGAVIRGRATASSCE